MTSLAAHDGRHETSGRCLLFETASLGSKGTSRRWCGPCSRAEHLVLAGVLEGSKSKARKFTETVELQIGLKNYDPQKDKRFSGSVKLPYCPRPHLKVCALA